MFNSFECNEWPDSSLGCPQPNTRYMQVTTEGYRIQLQAGDQVYTDHGGGEGKPFRGLKPGPQPEIGITTQPPLNLNEIPTNIVPPPRD